MKWNPVLPQQEGMWRLMQAAGAHYLNIPWAISVRQHVCRDLLEKAIENVVYRHSALRTRFRQFGRGLRQLVGWPSTSAYHFVDMRRSAHPQRALQVLLRSVRDHKFDFDAALMLQVWQIRLDATHDVLAFASHHLVFDGYSASIVMRDLLASYRGQLSANSPGHHTLPPCAGFQRYVQWIRSYSTDATLLAQRNYWARKLLTVRPQNEIPLPYATASSGLGAVWLEHLVEAQRYSRVAAFCRAERISLPMFLLTVFQLSVASWAGCGSTRFVLIVAGRTRTWHEDVVGFLAHGVFFHPEWSPTDTIANILEAVKSVVIDALENQDYPLELVVDDLRRRGVDCRTDQVACVFPSIFGEGIVDGDGALVDPKVVPVTDPTWRTFRDTNFFPVFGEQSLRIIFQFRQGRFERATMRRLRDFTALIIDQILADTHQTAAKLCATVQRAKCGR